MSAQRLIRRATNQSRAAVADLLEMLLVAELVAPGSRLMVISPWISDFPIIDNRAGQFGQLDVNWSASRIRFSGVLRSLLSRGVRVSLACRPGPREDDFVDRLALSAGGDGTGSLLQVRQGGILDDPDRAHEKALVADSWAVHGSMNFTYSGVELNGELLTFTTELETVAAMAAEFSVIFG